MNRRSRWSRACERSTGSSFSASSSTPVNSSISTTPPRGATRPALRSQPGFEGYDAEVMAPGADLAGVAAAAGEQWRALRRAEGASLDLSEIIDDPDGRLPPDLFEQLLAQRDDRFLYLAE